jgi:carbamoyl-phosphate synthase / aspartate carbamoyltransferase / dihydroorotase
MTNIIKLPGLIDTHVHLREPGSTQKEDFETGTKAAIAGGYTLVLDMPNNPDPVVNPEALQQKIALASRATLNSSEGSPVNAGTSRIYCDLGFHFGGTGDAAAFFEQVKNQVFGLKVYMNHTTGPLLIEDNFELDLIFSKWPKDKVLMVHAEQETLAKAIVLAKKYDSKLHVCHVARKFELELVQAAKSEGLNITCEVAMHHLYLTVDDVTRLKSFGMMRPPLAQQEDVDYLWANINSIDIVASDHAPHTWDEKLGEKIVNGVPGLETTLPLLLNAVNEKKITIDRLIEMTSTNPRKIFNVPEQQNTYVEVDMDATQTLSNEALFTKAGWTPFVGMEIKGKIISTVLRGEIVFNEGQIVDGGSGQVIFPVEISS